MKNYKFPNNQTHISTKRREKAKGRKLYFEQPGDIEKPVCVCVCARACMRVGCACQCVQGVCVCMHQCVGGAPVRAVCVCRVCVCGVCVCQCVRLRVCVCALRIVSRDKNLCFKNT